jgi:hypothetical protein
LKFSKAQNIIVQNPAVSMDTGENGCHEMPDIRPKKSAPKGAEG